MSSLFNSLFQKNEDQNPQQNSGNFSSDQPQMQNNNMPAQGQNGQPNPMNNDQGGNKVNPILKQDMTALSHLDPRSTQVLTTAYQEAKKHQSPFIEPDYILLSLVQDKDVYKLLEDMSVNIAELTRQLQARASQGNFMGEPTLAESTKQVLEQAYTGAKQRGVDFVMPEDILMALFSANTPVANDLKNQGVEKKKIEEKLSKNTEFKTGKKSALTEFGIDLTEQAAQGKLDPVAGREEETRRLIHILIRRTKNNPIIIGEPGTGKTAIVEGLAQLIASGRVPQELQGRKIIQLEISSLVAGASHRGEFEERLQHVIKETMDSNGQIVLFIDEIHTILGAGGEGGALDASNILKPYLARGQVQVIGATTTSEFRKYFEKDRAFERRFQSVIAEEPKEEMAIEMLKILQPKYEKFHNVKFSPEAIEQAVKLSKRYIGDRFLPDKAIDLLDEASSELRLQTAEKGRSDNVVKPEDIEKIVSAWTGIPITKLTEKESEKLLHLEDLIHKKYINHDRAVKAVAEAVRRGRIGLASANRPIASFIFLGPTGTGKTEIAKILAEIMFGSPTNMIRLDMSEYMEKHEVAKLIGAPPGYVGYEEGGQLTEAVRKKPYSIVLLDEIEKAHPDVFNIMLQLLEDGRLTDNKGNTISFKNTVVIATSNVGSQIIREQIEKIEKEKAAANGTQTDADKLKNPLNNPTASTGYYQGMAAQTPQHPQDPQSPVQQPGQPEHPDQKEEKAGNLVSGIKTGNVEEDKKFKEMSKLVLDELNKHFKPEFLNRFDEIVMFEPLNQENMAQIAKLGVESVKKMLAEQHVELQISQVALNQLAKDGFDPVYGARPLRRIIQREIENPVAIYLIQKSVGKGDTIIVDYDTASEKFLFKKQGGSQQNTQQPENPQAPTQADQPQPADQPPSQPAGEQQQMNQQEGMQNQPGMQQQESPPQSYQNGNAQQIPDFLQQAMQATPITDNNNQGQPAGGGAAMAAEA